MAKLFLGPALITNTSTASTSAAVQLSGVQYNSTFSAPTAETWSTSATATAASVYRQTKTFNHLFYCSTTAPTVSKFLAGGRAGDTALKIYSGTMPTIAAITAKTDGLLSWDNQMLISFLPVPYSATGDTGFKFATNPFSPSTGVSNTTPYTTGMVATLGIASAFTAAVKTGTASWFYFGYANAGATTTSLATRCFVIGTVSAFGMNGDLQVADTEIQSGGLYKSYGFKFQIPVEYEV